MKPIVKAFALAYFLVTYFLMFILALDDISRGMMIVRHLNGEYGAKTTLWIGFDFFVAIAACGLRIFFSNHQGLSIDPKVYSAFMTVLSAALLIVTFFEGAGTRIP